MDFWYMFQMINQDYMSDENMSEIKALCLWKLYCWLRDAVKPSIMFTPYVCLFYLWQFYGDQFRDLSAKGSHPNFHPAPPQLLSRWKFAPRLKSRRRKHSMCVSERKSVRSKTRRSRLSQNRRPCLLPQRAISICLGRNFVSTRASRIVLNYFTKTHIRDFKYARKGLAIIRQMSIEILHLDEIYIPFIVNRIFIELESK